MEPGPPSPLTTAKTRGNMQGNISGKSKLRSATIICTYMKKWNSNIFELHFFHLQHSIQKGLDIWVDNFSKLISQFLHLTIPFHSSSRRMDLLDARILDCKSTSHDRLPPDVKAGGFIVACDASWVLSSTSKVYIFVRDRNRKKTELVVFQTSGPNKFALLHNRSLMGTLQIKKVGILSQPAGPPKKSQLFSENLKWRAPFPHICTCHLPMKKYHKFYGGYYKYFWSNEGVCTNVRKPEKNNEVQARGGGGGGVEKHNEWAGMATSEQGWRSTECRSIKRSTK